MLITDSGNGFEADVKPKVREIGETPKPPFGFNKKKRDAEHLQTQMISMLGQEDDEIDLVFHAMSKRIKKNLTDEETEDLMEELSSVVTKHVRQARAKENQPQRTATPPCSCIYSYHKDSGVTTDAQSSKNILWQRVDIPATVR